MTKIITAAQMQALDRRTISEAHIPATILMEHAGSGVVSCLEQRFGPVRGKRVTVVCGKGNNGGDGFVVARLLHRRHANVRVLAMAPSSELSLAAATMYKQFVRRAPKSSVYPYSSKAQAQALFQDSDILIDALLGTGLSATVTGRYAEAIDGINETGRPVVAVDLPSGLHADTGTVLGRAIRATLTVTFGLPKLGLYQNDGIDLAGEVALVDIGIPPAYIDAVQSRTTLITPHEVRAS
jgi:hydroxyethylthiazole kinase-like uncharacterized protein yjeF